MVVEGSTYSHVQGQDLGATPIIRHWGQSASCANGRSCTGNLGLTKPPSCVSQEQHRHHLLLTMPVFLFTDLTTYDSVKHFLLLNTPLVDNSVTHSVARCRIPQLPLFCCRAFPALLLDLPLRASTSPCSLVVTLLIKCTFIAFLGFFAWEDIFVQKTQNKGCNHCYKSALTRSPLLMHLNTSYICEGTGTFTFLRLLPFYLT